MTDNGRTLIGKAEDELTIIRAQNRVLRLYRRVFKHGGYRAMVELLQTRLKARPGYLVPRLNISHVYNFIKHGKIPPKKYRRAVYLPQVLPSERRAYIKKIMPGLLELADYFDNEGWRKK